MTDSAPATSTATSSISRIGSARGFLLIAVAFTWFWVIFEQAVGQRSLHDAFIIAGVLVLIAALAVPRRPSDLPLRRSDLLAVVVLSAAGVLPRALFFDSFPPPTGQLWEESQLAKIAVDSIRHGSLDPYFPIPNLLAELAFRLFDVSLYNLRLPFLAAGIAAVPVYFFAARALGVVPFAYIAATALFASSAYLSASARIAFEPQSPILTYCAALAACLAAARQPDAGRMALAGFFTGLLMTEYTCYKVYPPLLFAMLLHGLAVHPVRRGAAAAAALLAIFAAFAIAAMAPILLVPGSLFVQAEGIVRHRAGLPSAPPLSWDAIAAAAERVGVSLAQIFLRGSSNDVVPDDTGVLEVYTGVIGSLALIYCALRARRSPPALFFVVAVLATVIPAGVLTAHPARYRLTGLPPLYFMAIALVIDALIRRRPAPRLKVLLAAGIAALCAINLHLLFAVTMHHPRVHAEFGDRAMALALQIHELQRQQPAVVLLDVPEDYLVVENDYSFIYDLNRLRLVRERAELEKLAGPLLTDATRSSEVQALPSIANCREVNYEYGPLLSFTFLVCDNAPSAKGTIDEHPFDG